MGALAELLKLGLKTAAKQADEVVPKAVSQIDETTDILKTLGKKERLTPKKSKINLNDSVVHSAGSDLESIAQEGLRKGSYIEKAGDKEFSNMGHRLIYDATPDKVGTKVSRAGMEDKPFHQLKNKMPPEKLKMIEFDAEDFTDINGEIKRLQNIFGSRVKVRPYWLDENGKMWYSKSAFDKSEARIIKNKNLEKELWKKRPLTGITAGGKIVTMQHGGQLSSTLKQLSYR